MDTDSLLPDALLRQLMAVGQVDILVGLPTLDNAATILDIVRAVHLCFTRDYPRQRTVLINSDGGSTDGTPDVIRNATFTEADRVQTSHPLRTLHRVLAPYHGLPGKHAALRTILTAADLTQAKTLVVIDPSGPATVPERVSELIGPVSRGDVEFLAPRSPRHPRDGTLITQLVRPLVRTLYAINLDEPLGSEFSCSGRFASHCLERDIWNHQTAKFAIDLWLRAEAAAEGFTLGQIWRPPTAPAGSRPGLRDVVHQVVISLIECLRAHDAFWRTARPVSELRSWGDDPGLADESQAWDYTALADQARHDIKQIAPLLERVLEPRLAGCVLDQATGAAPPLDDELWVRTVYGFAIAVQHGRAGMDHLADIFAPLYMWRAAAFMAATAGEPPDAVQARLTALADTFHRLKPALVAGWSGGV